MQILQKCLIVKLLFATSFLSAQMSVTIQVDHNISCFGGSDGSLTAVVTPAGVPYTFSWSNGATTANNSGLGTGAYVVTVQNAAGGTVIATANLGEPEELLLTSLTELPLLVNPTGNVEVETGGGTAPYVFQWTDQNNLPFANSEDLIDAPAGVYTQTATDANGCTATLTPVTLTLVSGAEELVKKSLSAFPNPASQYITFQVQAEDKVPLQVFNQLGQLMGSAQIQHQSVTIAVENWSPGMYTVFFPTLKTSIKIRIER